MPVSLDFQNLTYCVKSFFGSWDPVLTGVKAVMLLFLKWRHSGVELSAYQHNYQGCRACAAHEGTSSSTSKFLRMSFYFLCTKSPISLFERKDSFFDGGKRHWSRGGHIGETECALNCFLYCSLSSPFCKVGHEEPGHDCRERTIILFLFIFRY